MLRGFYTIASGMLAQQRNLDVIGNNLVNSETPGYRAQRMTLTTFQHELMIRKEAYGKTPIGTASPVTLVDDVATLHHSGLFQDTAHPFDIAIDGPGYFVVQGNEAMPYLTRGGQFNMDEEGFLILPGQGRVMGLDGAIQVGSGPFRVAEDGTITNEAGRRIGALQIVSPPDVSQLTRFDNGLYQLQNLDSIEQAEGLRVLQGVIEKSNVDYNREMTLLIETQRAFQSCSSALQMIDAMNRKAASQIASV
jgi:flagellar basal-body rod protein FlgG